MVPNHWGRWCEEQREKAVSSLRELQFRGANNSANIYSAPTLNTLYNQFLRNNEFWLPLFLFYK